jgi:hypothetical protein
MPAWFICTINGAQVNSYEVNPPVVSVALTDVAGSFGTSYQFNIPDAAKREILAVALAAISTQSNVSAFVDPPPTGGQCYALEILAS